MRIDMLSREYPPEVYGGAGVHVAELVRAMRELPDGPEVRVRAFGASRVEPEVYSYLPPEQLQHANPAMATLGVDLQMGQDADAELVHSHTWYANGAGHLAKLLHGGAHVLTAHSLEPLRPWKAEQLGGGYRISSWVERIAYESADAIIAVSEGMLRDILRAYPFVDPDKTHVVYNGIDLECWHPVVNPDGARQLGIDPDRPTIVFVGRITRQKGLPYLLRAAAALDPEVQLVLCAGAADTPEILREVESLVDDLRVRRDGVVWIDRILPRDELLTVLSTATLFVCPSVYEPLGIVNLEAMACGVPVVGTATGGIPEVVSDGKTGWLVPIEQTDDGTGTPLNPQRFVADLAERLAEALSDPARACEFGQAGLRVAREKFSWAQIARQTVSIYQQLRR